MVNFSPVFILNYLGILFAAISISCCDPWSQKTYTNEEAKTKIVSDADLQLPAFVRVEEFYVDDRSVDETWVAKLRLPRSSKDSILSSLRSKLSEDIGRSPAVTGGMKWWNPQGVLIEKTYYSHSCALVNAIFCDNEEDLVLYLECVYF
jgi:hypothetical protein